MKRIYIATKFQNKGPAQDLADELEKRGHKITFKWWFSKQGFTEKEAKSCTMGVASCDIFIGLFEENFIYQGSISEFGMAIAWEKKILIIGNALDNMVFMLLPGIQRFPDVNTFLTELDKKD